MALLVFCRANAGQLVSDIVTNDTLISHAANESSLETELTIRLYFREASARTSSLISTRAMMHSSSVTMYLQTLLTCWPIPLKSALM